MNYLLLLLPIFTILGILDWVTGFDIEDRLGRRAAERAAMRRRQERDYERLMWLMEEERKLLRGEPSEYDRFKNIRGMNPYRMAREQVEYAQDRFERKD